MQKSFDTLKHALTTAPVLAYPNFSKPFLVATDTSSTAIGAVLSQLDEDGENTQCITQVENRTKQKRIIRRMKEKD